MSFTNPALPITDARAIFEQRGSTVIHNFLMPTVATHLKALLKSLKWNLAVSDQGEGKIISAHEIQADPEYAKKAVASAWNQRDSFSFAYHNVDLIEALKNNEQLNPALASFVEQINTPSFHKLLSDITGLTNFTRVSAQLTNYLPGDFLTMHNDFVLSESRACAYVLSLADPWQSEWGGNLHLYSEDEVTETRKVVPRFNSLTLFRTPQKHLVSKVTPSAGGERISITGWLSTPN